jgi:hypothetical protein
MADAVLQRQQVVADGVWIWLVGHAWLLRVVRRGEPTAAPLWSPEG